MTDEEKQKAETAKAEAEAKAQAEKEKADADFEAEIADLSDEEKEVKRAEKEALNPDNIDYEAELKKEREAREKAEKALADKRFKDAEKKRKEGGGEGNDDAEDDDKPLTAKELQNILAKEREITQKDLQVTRISDIARKLAGSDAEASLIVEVHKNRSFPSHLTLEEQVEEAYVIANRKKIMGQNSELKRALKGKDGIVTNSAGTHQDVPKGGEPTLSGADAQAIKVAGMVWNGVSRQYEKKLSNGSLLIRDSRTKQTRLIRK